MTSDKIKNKEVALKMIEKSALKLSCWIAQNQLVVDLVLHIQTVIGAWSLISVWPSLEAKVLVIKLSEVGPQVRVRTRVPD